MVNAVSGTLHADKTKNEVTVYGGGAVASWLNVRRLSKLSRFALQCLCSLASGKFSKHFKLPVFSSTNGILTAENL